MPAPAGVRRQKAVPIMTGLPELDAKLKELSLGVANKAARAGLTKGARLAASKIKAAVPSKIKSVRKSIRHSVKRAKGGVTVAKAGAAVGVKKSAQQQEMESNKSARKAAKRKGVGIGARNIHWWVLGTKDRYTKAGKWTGRMPKDGFIKPAVASSMPQIEAAIREGTLGALQREVERMGRK